MKMVGVSAVGLMLMLGAGCSSASTTTGVQSGAVTQPVAEKIKVEEPKVPVAYSAVKSDLFGIIGKYSELTFSNAVGTCVKKFPYTALSYSPSEPGKNFMLRDVGAVIDDRSSSNTESVLFKGNTVDGNKVECKLMVPYGKDTATLTCADAAEKEICSSTYTTMALPL